MIKIFDCIDRKQIICNTNEPVVCLRHKYKRTDPLIYVKQHLTYIKIKAKPTLLYNGLIRFFQKYDFLFCTRKSFFLNHKKT